MTASAQPAVRAESLAVAGRVPTALGEVVAAVRRRSAPRFVVAEGGTTSQDVATRGLGVRRARVVGQVFEGTVPVRSTVDADVGAGLPFVVSAGNVGDEHSLARTVEVLGGRATPPP